MRQAPRYAPTGEIRRGSRLTGMTEETAPAAGRPPLGRATDPKNKKALSGPAGAAPNPAERKKKIRRTDGRMNLTALLEHVPEHARPTESPELDGLTIQAERNGWTDETLARELRRGVGPNTGTGYVVTRFRKLATSARPSQATTTPTAEAPGHHPCRDHGEPCELCYCHGLPPRHHVTVPMPDHVKAQLGNGIL